MQTDIYPMPSDIYEQLNKVLAEWYLRLWTRTPSDLIRKDVGRKWP